MRRVMLFVASFFLLPVMAFCHTPLGKDSEEPLLIFEMVDDDDDDYYDGYLSKTSSREQIEPKKAKENFQWFLAATIVFQNEAPWLKEWIEYHKLVGVEHFYLYNNLSTDDYDSVLKPYIDSGEVELIDWPFAHEEGKEGSWIKVQTDAINDAVSRAKDKAKWLAIVDADEFIVPVKHDSLPAFLKAYDKVVPKLSQISIKWVMFGTSYVEKIPEDKLMTEMLTMNSGRTPSSLFKVIVKPKDVTGCGTSHYCGLSKGRKWESAPFEFAQINHYWTRDEDYFLNVKVPRRLKIGYSWESVFEWAESFNGDNPESSLPITRFLPALKQRLGKAG
ncbi:glycosyltransferase family 92 protein [Estrella lausannensis]|uniref:Conserved putative secreted protein n=1 Tax=Estrella lausannensis TaxID=483423 RepID=A0A0H5DSX0_9BACT|nr:glycosyltransferase family 92 protein [Estrella lausannensis]CRX38914.1 Conserved putative secreted protein [Estrella lausannensis]